MRQSEARPRGGIRGRRRLDFERAEVGEVVEFAADVVEHSETSPRLTGGDVDADWHGAYANGDEAVGGSTATPDQDVVDELGEALGVPQALDAEVLTSADILKARDQHRWRTEREMVLEERDAEER